MGRNVRWVVGVVALVGALGTGGALYTVEHYDDRIERVDPFSGLPSRPPGPTVSPVPAPPTGPAAAEQVEEVEEVKEALNVLLVGSDTREGEGNEGFGQEAGARADTVIVVHIPADRDSLTMVSIPRDSYVTLPACSSSERKGGRMGRLNSAHAGGPACTVAAVEALSGIWMDHYVEVDFDGVTDVVDALGGVDVCLPRAVRDPQADLDLPAGTSHVDGRQALAFARSRKFDPRGDLGRVERQQQLLTAMLAQAQSREVLLDPRQLKAFLDTVTTSVKTDPDLGVRDILELARELRTVRPDALVRVTVPVLNADHRVGKASTVKLDEEGTRELFAAVNAGRPVPGAAPAPTPPPPGDTPC